MLDGARRLTERVDSGLKILQFLAAKGGYPSARARLGDTDVVEPCFVLSTGRAGTMTLSSLLEASPLIDAHHEMAPRLIEASYLAYMQPPDIPDGFWRDTVAVARDPAVFSAYRRGKVFFESNNRLTFLADALAEHYPRSRFIVMTRAPIGFVRSAVDRGYYAGHRWDYARVRPRPGDPDAPRWKHMSQVERCVWLWKSTTQHCLDFVDRLDPSRSFFLKSEDLFDGNDGVIDGLFQFVSTSDAPPRARTRSVLSRRLNRQKTSRSARLS
jgi:hypothetical protein